MLAVGPTGSRGGYLAAGCLQHPVCCGAPREVSEGDKAASQLLSKSISSTFRAADHFSSPVNGLFQWASNNTHSLSYQTKQEDHSSNRNHVCVTTNYLIITSENTQVACKSAGRLRHTMFSFSKCKLNLSGSAKPVLLTKLVSGVTLPCLSFAYIRQDGIKSTGWGHTGVEQFVFCTQLRN